MYTIYANVVGRKIRMKTNERRIVSNSTNFIYISFDFNALWDKYQKCVEVDSKREFTLTKDSNGFFGFYIPDDLHKGTFTIRIKGTFNSETVYSEPLEMYVKEKEYSTDNYPIEAFALDVASTEEMREYLKYCLN